MTNVKIIIEIAVFAISFLIAQGLSIFFHRKHDIEWHQTGICFAIMFIPSIITELILKV